MEKQNKTAITLLTRKDYATNYAFKRCSTVVPLAHRNKTLTTILKHFGIESLHLLLYTIHWPNHARARWPNTQWVYGFRHFFPHHRRRKKLRNWTRTRSWNKNAKMPLCKHFCLFILISSANPLDTWRIIDWVCANIVPFFLSLMTAAAAAPTMTDLQRTIFCRHRCWCRRRCHYRHRCQNKFCSQNIINIVFIEAIFRMKMKKEMSNSISNNATATHRKQKQQHQLPCSILDCVNFFKLKRVHWSGVLHCNLEMTYLFV